MQRGEIWTLRDAGYAMTDKIVTVDKSLLGYCVGRVSDREQAEISRALKRVLGLENA